MTLDYMIGSARDPNGANRQTRKRVEAAVRRSLRAGGVQTFTSVEAASVAGLLEELRQAGVQDRQ